MGLKKTDEYKIKYPIVGFVGLENHTATKGGNIYNKHGMEVGYQISPSQPQSVISTANRIRYLRERIIATLFIPNPYNKTLVTHITKDKSNDNVDNLQWVTRRELNTMSASKTNKLSKKKADNIRKLYAEGNMTHSKLAKKYKVSQSTIAQVLNNRLWTDYDPNMIIRDPLLNALLVKKIREEYAEGEVTQTDLADKYNIKPGMVSKIINNKIWY